MARVCVKMDIAILRPRRVVLGDEHQGFGGKIGMKKYKDAAPIVSRKDWTLKPIMVCILEKYLKGY